MRSAVTLPQRNLALVSKVYERQFRFHRDATYAVMGITDCLRAVRTKFT